MSIFFTLLIMFIFAKLIIKCSSRKSYIITGTIITLVIVLSELNYIISSPKNYLLYESWQVALAYIIYLVYVFTNTSTSKRNRSFNKNIKTKTKDTFNTAKANGVYLIIISFIILLIGIGLLIIRLLDVFENIPYVVYIGSVIGFIGLFITGVLYIKLPNEKLILLIRTNEEFYTYYVDIKSKFKFNYMEYIGDIYRYYIIEKLGIFKYSGDKKEIHYVFILDTENLNNYDISKLNMNILDSNLYNELIKDIYKYRNAKVSILIKNNELIKMKKS